MKKAIISFMLVIINIITASNFAIQPYPITFDQVPLSQTVLAGADVSFSCSAAIYNVPTLPHFIWYHDNTELTDGNISYTGINMSTLYIYNVTEVDQGEYYCIVTDWETRTKSNSGKLIVYRHDATKGQHLNVTSNETITLQCNFDSMESGRIQWFRNGNPVNFMNQRFHQLQDGSLVILQVNSSDDGMYACNATMNGGHLMLQYYEMITVPMDREQINEGISLYPENFTHFTKNMTIVCQIPSSLKVYNVTWTRNGTAIDLSTEGIEVVEYNLLIITDMHVSSNEYKCMIYKNSSDDSPTTSSPLVVYKYSIPVVEHSNTTDHYVCANLNTSDFSCINGAAQTVDLHCSSVGGFPIPTVTWYHNGVEMINANVFNGTLMLNKTACDLLGTYQCIVSNEVGSKITVFRILPYGWPNVPNKPELSTEGRILYVNWKNSIYFGGLNSSLIQYEIKYEKKPYPPTDLFKSNKYDCGSVNDQCSKTLKYKDLRIGGKEIYYVKLNIKQHKNMMCQGYNTPLTFTSLESSIVLSKIMEYGPPLVNLTCSNEEYATVTSLPTGYLSANEMLNNLFVIDCKLYWTCTNASGTDYHQNTTYPCGGNFTIPWRSYNCSADVIYDYHNGESMAASKYCLSSNYTEDVVALNELKSTSLVALSTYSEITQTLPVFAVSTTILPTTVNQGTPTVSLLPTRSGSSLVGGFTMLPISTNQVTPISSLLPVSNESSLDGSSIGAIALSSFIALVFVVFITIYFGLICCKRRRKQQIHKFSTTERPFHSLDSIPEAYSHIGREDQSVCEKPSVKVANWINSHDECEEIASINSDDLSNEQILDALYGSSMVKAKHSNDGKIAIDADKIPDGHSSFISEDASSSISSTLLTDYMCKLTTHANSDDLMTDSSKFSSTIPTVMMEYAEIAADSRKASIEGTKSEMQYDVLFHGYSLTSVDDMSDTYPENTLSNQENSHYVSLSNNPKICSAGIDASDHGDYIEYDDIKPKRVVIGQNHGSES